MTISRTCLFVAVGVALFAQPGRVFAAPRAMDLEHYRLDNGLEVILQPDPTIRTAVVHVWYHVGSKDESIGKTGFAHLFEHLMFKGSKHTADGQFDRLLEGVGGWNNGTTSNDRTNYFEQVPVANLPLALWLEADRLAGLWDAMNQSVLDNQRDVVKEERRQSYENRPYGTAELQIPQTLWPRGHGNWNLTIGSMEDLTAANLADVESFWRTYYRPSNATLVIVGGFDVPRTKALIQTLFAWIPTQAVPKRRILDEPVRPLDKAISLQATDDVQVPKVYITMRAPEAHGAGATDLLIAAQILGGGKASRLHRRLVFKDQIATEANASINPQFLGSEFTVDATARPGVSAATIRAALEDELRQLLTRPPAPAEFERARRVQEVTLLSSLEDPVARAGYLAQWAAYTGDPDHVSESLAELAAVTPTTFQTAVKAWLRIDAAVTMEVTPKSKPAAAPAGGAP